MSEEVKPKAEVVPNTAVKPPEPEELSDEDLGQVSGGRSTIIGAKSADKARDQFEAYIKS